MRLLIALIVFAALAVPAHAGTYEHHTLPTGMDGWAPGAESVGGFVAAGAGPDRLWTRFWARPWFEPGELAEWVYTAAADTTIAGWEVQRTVTGVAAGDWNTLFGAIVDGRWHHVAWDVPSVERPWSSVGGSGPAGHRLVARLACGGPHACAGPAAMELRAARIVLHDAHAPTVSDVHGELASDRVLAGTAGLAFAAADRGGGVYRAFAEVDGRLGPPVAIGDDRCRDAVPGGADPHQFAHRRPCPAQAGATVLLDTTALADGRHTIAVHVEDAAGNRTTAYGPTSRTVDNHPGPPPPAAPGPPPPAAPDPPPPAASDGPPQATTTRPTVTAWLERGRRRRRAVTVPYGERVRIRGRATSADGRPLARATIEIAEQLIDGDGRRLAGATIELAERVLDRRGSWRRVTGVVTGADGRFVAFARVGPSRRLRVASAPRLTVRVRAPVTIRARGRVVRGRLLGRHVPRRGALVEIQTRQQGRWSTVRVARTFRSGRFSARLERAAQAVRVRVPRQAGLPFAAGLARAPTAQPSA